AAIRLLDAPTTCLATEGQAYSPSTGDVCSTESMVTIDNDSADVSDSDKCYRVSQCPGRVLIYRTVSDPIDVATSVYTQLDMSDDSYT
ncbi:hypothetical protein KIPB_014316, partial [Kipferlia bialata]